MKPTRTKQQRERDKMLITELYVQGVPQMEIAKKLGISQGQVSNDWKKIVSEWQESRFEELDRYKHEQLKRIDIIEREMWEAWHNSKTAKKVSSVKSKSGRFKDANPAAAALGMTSGEGKIADEEFWRASIAEEDPRGGDMQFMNGIMWCVAERTKLLGLYAPKKIAQTDPTGEHEAGSGVRDDLMGLIAAVLKRSDPAEPKSGDDDGAVDGEVVEAGDSDYEIARQLKEARAARHTPKKLKAVEETFGMPDEKPEGDSLEDAMKISEGLINGAK